MDLQCVLVFFCNCVIDIRNCGDFVKGELLFFFDVEGDEIIIMFVGQFGVYVGDMEIYIVVGLIEIVQYLFVEFDLVFNQCVVVEELM